HHDGMSPAWPISYDDLEPYYTRAEQAYEVHGVRGEDPTEGPASAPYPFPAVSHEPRIQQLADDLEAAGYRPFHAPCGIRPKQPNGLANGSDQVGRNYMFHASQAVLALSRDENPTVFQKTLGLNDFYFGSDDHGYPLGNIQMVGKSQAPMFHGEKPMETRLSPGWSLEKIA